jgi:hypothetical protein
VVYLPGVRIRGCVLLTLGGIIRAMYVTILSRLDMSFPSVAVSVPLCFHPLLPSPLLFSSLLLANLCWQRLYSWLQKGDPREGFGGERQTEGILDQCDPTFPELDFDLIQEPEVEAIPKHRRMREKGVFLEAN